MTNENAKKKYNHLKFLIDGNYKSGNPVKDELIVSDAKKHMANLLIKRPNIIFEEVKEEVKSTKSKGNK